MSLNTLPTEIISIIAQNLSIDDGYSHNQDPDLQNLRLTCRALHERTLHDFGTAYFNCITVQLQPYGLERLKYISQHAQLRSYIRTLDLGGNDRLDLDFRHIWNPIAQDLESRSDYTNSNHTPASVQAVIDFVHSREFESDLRLCIKPLSNLEYIGIGKLYRMKLRTHLSLREYRMAFSAIVECTLSIVHDFKIHLKGLEIEDHSWYAEALFDISVFESISKQPELFSRLEELRLHASLENDAEPAKSNLMPILKKAESLETLQLYLKPQHRFGAQLSAFAHEICHFQNLKNLNLTNAKCSEVEFLDFISTCKDTLKDIRLLKIILSSGTWRNIFRFLSKETALSCLHFFWLTDTQVVKFEAFNKERPIAVEDWVLNEEMGALEESDMAMLNSFLFVTWSNLPNMDHVLSLREQEGDNLSECLATVAQIMAR